MIGLIMLVVAFFYIGWWIAITYFSYVWTKKLTNSKGNALTVSALLFIVMYLIPFWDWIPTVLAHKHYCEAEAKLTIFKTPEQWDEENPGVLEELIPYERRELINFNDKSVYKINDRFGFYSSVEKISKYPVKKLKTQIIDMKKNEIVVQRVEFSRGYGPWAVGGEGSWKFWLVKNHCGERAESVHSFKIFRQISLELKMERN
jgi:hypothetical protein